MHVTFSVYIVLLEWIFIPRSISQSVSVEARVLERTVPFALSKMFAGNGSQCLAILINKFVFEVTLINHACAWNDQITVLSADGAGPVMSLLDFLIVSGSPVSDALETERMLTIFKNSELSVVCQDFFKANDAFFVALVLRVTLVICVLGGCCHG